MVHGVGINGLSVQCGHVGAAQGDKLKGLSNHWLTLWTHRVLPVVHAVAHGCMDEWTP